ncbi:MAG: ABC transporter permease [Anaerolineae bacterium]|nr:MAG: ABC transporter permease [Anaerolineae bacterium]
MGRRIWAVIQKEFIQTLRDRRTLAIQLALPLIQLFLYGYAIRMNVDHVPTVVADQSLDAASRAYVEAMTTSGYFDVVAYVPDQAEAVRAVDEGQAQAAVVIPPGFAARVERGEAQALLVVDGSDLFTSQSAYNAASSIAQAHATELLMARMERTGQASGQAAGMQGLLPLEARIRILSNPNLDELWFLVPGMLAMLLQVQSITLTAAAVVREREVGTIEQILVTPIRPGELMLGKVVPNIVIALVNLLTILGLGVFWFGVPFQGNFWLFLWLAFLYVFSGLGLGLLISTVSQNQKQAQQLIGMFTLVGIVLGGFVFPRYAMPPAIRVVGWLFPLTYFIPISRGIITKGVGIEFMWEQVGALFVYIVVIMVFAARAFKEGLD